MAKLGFAVVIGLIIYNLASGLIAKKVGIPGIFEIEFDTREKPEPTPVSSTPTPVLSHIFLSEQPEVGTHSPDQSFAAMKSVQQIK